MKISAGADFIQTQCIYNMEKFRQFMKMAVDMGLHEKAYILAGVTPMKSVGMAQYMAKMVPGMDVPENLLKRLRGAGKGKVAEEGIGSPSNRSKNSRKWKGSPACTSWPSNGSIRSRKSLNGPVCYQGRKCKRKKTIPSFKPQDCVLIFTTAKEGHSFDTETDLTRRGTPHTAKTVSVGDHGVQPGAVQAEEGGGP